MSTKNMSCLTQISHCFKVRDTPRHKSLQRPSKLVSMSSLRSWELACPEISHIKLRATYIQTVSQWFKPLFFTVIPGLTMFGKFEW